MSSYYTKNGIKYEFRFFENPDWQEDQESEAGRYFLFKIKRNDLKTLGYTYWAHIALWKNSLANEGIESLYKIASYEDDICKELDSFKIDDAPPNFGYNSEHDVTAKSWDYPKFKILKKTRLGLHCMEDDLDEFYFDFAAPDICAWEDLKFEVEKPKKGSTFTFNPGDPVFMHDTEYNSIQFDFLKKIDVLNKIYSKVNFPHQIVIEE